MTDLLPLEVVSAAPHVLRIRDASGHERIPQALGSTPAEIDVALQTALNAYRRTGWTVREAPAARDCFWMTRGAEKLRAMVEVL